MPQNRTPEEKRAGKRLKYIRELRGLTLKDFDKEYHKNELSGYNKEIQTKWFETRACVNTERGIGRWENEGIPEKKIPAVANCFKLHRRYFTDEKITDAEINEAVDENDHEIKIYDFIQKTQKRDVEKLGASKEAFKRILRNYGNKNNLPSDLDTLIKKAVQESKEIHKQLKQLKYKDLKTEKYQKDALIAFENGDFDEAQLLLGKAENKDAEAIIKIKRTLNSRIVSLAKTRALRGDIDNMLLNFTEAARHYKIAADMVSDSPESTIEHAAYLQKYGNACLDAGNYSESEEPLKQSLRIKRKCLGDNNKDIAKNLVDLAWTYKFLENFNEAVQHCQKALNIYKMNAERDSLFIAETLNKFGEIYKNKGDYKKAIGLFFQAFEIKEKIFGKNDIKIASSLDYLGDIYRINRNDDESEKKYKRALKIKEEILDSDHPDISYTLLNLGLLFHAQANFDEAKDYYEKSLKIREKIFEKDSPTVAYCLNMIGKLYLDQKKYDEAEFYVKQALEIRIKKLGIEVTTTAISYEYLGLIYHGQKRDDEAKEQLDTALSIVEKSVDKDHLCRAYILVSLGKFYCSLGKYSESLEYYEEALGIRKKRLRDKHPDIELCNSEIEKLRKK